MKIVEFHPEKQGRPYSPLSVRPGSRDFLLAPYSVRGIHLAGEFSRTTKMDDYDAADEMVILADASSIAITISLPTATTSSAKVYYIKKIDSSGNAVTIKGDSIDETIDGETEIVLTLQYQYVMIICDASDWFILGGEYVKMEDILKSVETLLELNQKTLEAILKVVASGQNLSGNKEDY